jgi:hypothetical protein
LRQGGLTASIIGSGASPTINRDGANRDKSLKAEFMRFGADMNIWAARWQAVHLMLI